MTNLLTIKQACAHLQRCRNTILAMIADGRLKAINLKRPGGKWDIWRVDISSAGEELSAREKLKLRDIERRLRI